MGSVFLLKQFWKRKFIVLYNENYRTVFITKMTTKTFSLFYYENQRGIFRSPLSFESKKNSAQRIVK